MKSYLKLVNFEVNRSLKFYVILFLLLTISQIIGVILNSFFYIRSVKVTMREEQLTLNEYISTFGTYSYVRVIYSEWFYLSIISCIAFMMMYVFFIWYRDWFGKSKFMYRLLMLPTSRIHIYMAKLTTIMLFVFGLIGLQLILILLEQNISDWLIPSEFRTNVSHIDLSNVDILSSLYPPTFIEFIASYGLGLTVVSVLFTAILLERSYRLKGIFFAVVYGLIVMGIFFAPVVLNAFYGNYLYSYEIIGIVILITIMIFASTIWLANYLLKYKIKV